MPLFSKPADFRRGGITLLLTACMCFPVVLRATEVDLTVRLAVDGAAPVPGEVVKSGDLPVGKPAAVAGSESIEQEPNSSAETPTVAESTDQPDVPSGDSQETLSGEVDDDDTDGTEPGADETEAAGTQHGDSQGSEVEGDDDMQMPDIDTASDVLASEIDVDSVNETPTGEARELSVAPGGDPLLPEEAPQWVGATPRLDAGTHTLVVSSMATVKRARVDAELDMPLCKTVMDYVQNDLIAGSSDVDLRHYVTADYIRKNLIDQPEGYVAEIATSNGPMYQKWVKVNVTPEQQKQLKAWYAEAVQGERLPPIGFGLAGLLGVVGLAHLVLRRKHAPATGPVEVDASIQPAAKSSAGIVGTLAVLGVMGLGVVSLGLFAARSRVAAVHTEIEREHARAARDAAMAEVTRAREEVQNALDRVNGAGDFANPADLFGTPGDSLAPAPPVPPETPEESWDSNSQLPNTDVTTTINRNGNQQIIIRTRSR
ncbi:MAG: hypothetical protein Aurels2KO_07430 [Aureliella sp.]